MFAESGGMGAAATLAGVNGEPGYYIHFYIDDIEFYAAFTGIFFKEGENIYVVYDEEIKQNFNVLAVMNKNNHLLGMVVPFGYTVAISDKAHNKTALIMGGVMAIGSCSIMAYFATNMHDIFESIYLYIYAIIFSFVLPLFIAYGIKKQFRGYAEESERIYKILGVKDLTVLEKTGMQAYIDPNNRMYDDVYNYTQFLDYDPQPLVDERTDESDLR